MPSARHLDDVPRPELFQRRHRRSLPGRRALTRFVPLQLAELAADLVVAVNVAKLAADREAGDLLPQLGCLPGEPYHAAVGLELGE